ncbi:MAG: hypothetical protein QNJ09_10720 [Paracoccaceae bacterium]|nr:hypothetical protein [Paracoccaceae bacterium]
MSEKLEQEIADLKQQVAELQQLVFNRMSVSEMQTVLGRKLSADDLKKIAVGDKLVMQNLMFTPPELDD